MPTYPVKGPHSGPKEAVKAMARAYGAKRIQNVDEFVDELYAQNTFDAYMICAQSSHETDVWRSKVWVDWLNPAGIGIMDGGALDHRPYTNGREAARATLIHHCAYTGTPIPEAWKSWVALDPRYQPAVRAYGGSVKNWDQYGNGRWATDPNYYNGILKHRGYIDAYRGSTVPTQPSNGGNMTQPRIIDKYLHITQDGYTGVNRRYQGTNGRKIIVLHIQEGTNWGSWQHFHNVSASSTVLIGRNGDIWRLVPETDGPWTNGDVCSPTAKGSSILNKYGGDPNRYSLTIETEGFASSNNVMGWLAWPKPQAQIDSVVWQVRKWMSDYNIPIENFIRHAEINPCTRRFCPGDDYYNYIRAAVEAGGGSAPQQPSPVYADRAPVKDADGNLWTGDEDLVIGNATFRADKRTVKAVAGVTFRTHATRKAGLTRGPLEAGKGFGVLGWVNGEEIDGERRWWITKNYSRVHVSGTVEKPSVEVPPVPDEDTEPQQPDEQPDIIEYGPQIVNGRAYYKVGLFVTEPVLDENGEPVLNDDDTPKLKPVDSIKVIVTEDEADARRTVKLKAPVHATFKRGDELIVTHFVVGDKVDDEEIWWVVQPQDATKNPIHHGLRVPAAYTNVRPS